MGVRFDRVPMARASISPLTDMITVWRYIWLMLKHRPEVVIAYTQKPIIYAGLAVRLFPRTRYYVIMSGLGYVFSAVADHRRRLRKLVSALYREGVRSARTVFVFNSDDRKDMLGYGILSPRHRVVQVPGSGIDTDRFAASPMPGGDPVVLMIARLMQDKGVYDFVEAARLVKARMPQVRFSVVGRMERDNPTAISAAEREKWSAEGLVEFPGETRDVRPHLTASTLFVLPTYYREGLPRTILEALATGRPVIATDVPGCRDAIVDGHNGRLIPPRDPDALAATIIELLSDRAVLQAMGRAARHAAVSQYDVASVNRMLLQAMELDAEGSSQMPGIGLPQYASRG